METLSLYQGSFVNEELAVQEANSKHSGKSYKIEAMSSQGKSYFNLYVEFKLK